MASRTIPTSPAPSPTPSPSLLRYPHLELQDHQDQRLSYATTSPPTPNAEKLFYRPPILSTPSSPIPQTYQRENSPLSQKIRPSHSQDASVCTSGEASSDIAVGYGIDIKELADMLSPPESSNMQKDKGKRSKRKGKNESKNESKGKDKERQDHASPSSSNQNPSTRSNVSQINDNSPVPSSASSIPRQEESSSSTSFTQAQAEFEASLPPETPPPLPPKPLPPSFTPKSTHTIHSIASSLSLSLSLSRLSHSAETTTTTTEVHSPQKALHGRMTSASSHQLTNKPSFPSFTNSNSNTNQSQSDSQSSPFDDYNQNQAQNEDQFNDQYSPMSYHHERAYEQDEQFFTNIYGLSGSLHGENHASSSSSRTPTYSFLAKDPLATFSRKGTTHSRNKSTSSSKSNLSLPPITNAMNDERRSSRHSVYSGMADFQVSNMSTEQSPISNDERSYSVSSNHASGSGDGNGNGSASRNYYDHDEYPSIKSAMATKASSPSNSKWSFRSQSKSRTSSNHRDSTKSTNSKKSKRASNSTISQRLKKWEIIFDHNENYEKEMRHKENQMDLKDLAGRAWVLERVLRSGKRVSSQSLRYLRPFTPSSSFARNRTPPTHHSKSNSGSTVHLTPRNSFQASSPHVYSRHQSYKSNHSPRKSTSTQSHSHAHSQSQSDRRKSTTSARSFRLKERWGKRLRRSESREDIFTELDSEDTHLDNTGHDRLSQDESEDAVVDTREPNTPALGLKHTVHSDDDHEEDDRQKGVNRIGGKGVIVFPEEQVLKPSPSLPPKDSTLYCIGSTRFNSCFSPTSPTPLLSVPLPSPSSTPSKTREEIEKRIEQGEVVMRYTRSPQSPHLGHRSPDYRSRQSVISYLETGVWEEKPKNRWRWSIIILSSLVVLLIIGLLVGLLIRRYRSS
ncbi:uncharacterized protein IL334_001409 [Kwoniella shivajii]|uniref:REJ domain-containing protein n=1 Tax=Kwoniella shivajii TaxID=564305 RepID=A0ABZ1CRT3_9TREE|nr:hypothetical protein IL334_001409 [Kwoniella shivajii]